MSDEIQRQIGNVRQEQIKISGFMSGLLQTRRGIPFDDDRGDDPFMQGYENGEQARDMLIEEAVLRVKPELSSRDRLESLVAEAEILLANLEAGTGFTVEPLTTEVARARVHLADTEQEVT